MADKQNISQEQNVSAIKKPASTAGQLHYPFWFGGSAASLAACVTHPLDLVKVRLQVRGPDVPKSMIRMFPYVVARDGIRGLYAGLTAALLRQMTYSTARFGIYEDLKQRYAPKPTSANPKPQLAMTNLILLSSVSGFIAGVVGNAADVLNVRMQSDTTKPPEARLNYKNAIDGMIKMVRSEGVSSMFRGVGPNATRAALMNASQLASYDIFKSAFMKNFGMGDNILTHFSASLSAGFVATTICSPADVIKTRIMGGGGKTPIADLLRNAFRDEGWLWMFRGWVPSFIRLGPQTICTMLFFEQHKKVYRQMKGIDIEGAKI